MCGRYAASAHPDDLIEAFEIEIDASAEPSRSVLVNPQTPPPGEPDYNMAPTKQAPVVLSRTPRAVTPPDDTPPDATSPDAGGDSAAAGTASGSAVRQLRHLTWGLVPPWASDPKVGVRMINARSETLLTSRAYAPAARARRCLVPARGWYEWQVSPVATDAKGKPRKQPFFISDPEQPIIAFAGLYEFWRDRTVADRTDPMAWLTTFTIITTDADPGLDRIHQRQPLVLESEHWSSWLDPTVTDPSLLTELLTFARPGRFTAYPVSRAVSSNRSNGPHLIDPVAADELVGVVDPETGEIIGG